MEFLVSREFDIKKVMDFFVRLLNSAVLPFIKFLGKNFLNAGANVANDLVDSDDFSYNNIKEVGKKRFGDQAKTMVKTAAEKILKGSGIKKKRVRKRSKKSIKSIKVKSKNTKRKTKRRKNRRIIKAKDFLSL